MASFRRSLILGGIAIIVLVVALVGLPYGKFNWKTFAQSYTYDEPVAPIPVPSDLLPNERRSPGGLCKWFYVTIGGRTYLQVYSGFDLEPPDGFLVGQFEVAVVNVGDFFQDPGLAAKHGWQLQITPTHNFTVFDDKNNIICTAEF